MPLWEQGVGRGGAEGEGRRSEEEEREKSRGLHRSPDRQKARASGPELTHDTASSLRDERLDSGSERKSGLRPRVTSREQWRDL